MSKSNVQNRPIISVAISPRSFGDRDTFQRALNHLARQDPTVRIETEPKGKQAIISGMSELHLGQLCDRILNEFKMQLDIGKPTVIYLETIRRHAEAEGKYVRHTGGHHQYGHAKVRLEPLEPGGGYQFGAEIAEGIIPPQYVESVNLGIQAAMKGGIIGGHEMVDLQAVLCDGSYHDEGSNEMTFKIAASMAFKEAARKASPVVLEPVMSAEVVAPEEFAGTIMGDLSSRRGRIEGMEHRADSQVVHAIVPMAEMFGYATHLHSNTQGRADYSMHFARYEEAPRRREPGGNEAAVTAKISNGPKAGSGSAAAKLDAEFE